MSATQTLTLDRDLVERLIVEIDGLAEFDVLRSTGGEGETPLQQHIYRVIEDFERTVFGPRTDEESERMHNLGIERGRELARELFDDALGEKVTADAR
jgi:hypothetical protein